MARSLLRQLEQIRRAATYDDLVSAANTATVAEPTVSGSLEEDTNVIRTMIRQMKNSSADWFAAVPTYTDPTATATPKDASLQNISGNTLDAKTIIVAVSDDAGGSGYTVSGTSTGALMALTAQYATDADETGLPIFASTANNGSYKDEGADDNVVRIDVVNSADDSEMQDSSGNVIYAKFHDAADHGGTGDGTDVYAKFYADGSEVDLSDVEGGAPSNVYFIYPRRKVLSDMQEHEWLRTDFVSSWEGDVELIEDIQNLWSYTGASDGVSSTSGAWSNATGNFLLSSDPADLFTAADLLNTGIGDRTYTETNYVSDAEDITTSLNALDVALQDVADDVASGVGEKYVESVTSEITSGSAHTLPTAIINDGGYTPFADAGREGKNMDVYVDGQLLAASTGAAGAGADRDYKEDDGSTVTFLFTIQVGRNITYVVRQ